MSIQDQKKFAFCIRTTMYRLLSLKTELHLSLQTESHFPPPLSVLSVLQNKLKILSLSVLTQRETGKSLQG